MHQISVGIKESVAGCGRLLLAFIFIACLLESGTAKGQTFIAISDIHFNPFHALNREQFHTLQNTPANQWDEFFQSLKQPISPPGQDSNYALMTSALDAAQRRASDPVFILYMGDFMAHDWQASYERLAAKSITEDPESYREFTSKVLAFMAYEFQIRFPDVPVIATLGNDDAFCGDYWLQLSSPFNRVFAQTWRPLLKDTVKEQEFTESFINHGAYCADLPGVEDQRVIVLNSIFWSASYCDEYFKPTDRGCCSCENPGPLPGRAQFAWLDQKLSQARKDKKRIWLLMHVPPGLDSYAEEKANGKCLTAEMWKAEFTARYLELIEEYQSDLQIGFAGHTHMDDFRILGNQDRLLLTHKIVPAVSRIFKNHSAFQVYQWNADHGLIQNWQTYYVDSSKETAPDDSSWELEYDARDAYQLESFTTKTVAQVFQQARKDQQSAPAQAFARYYGVSAWKLPEKDLPIYFGTVLSTLYSDFARELRTARPDLSIRRQQQGLMRRPVSVGDSASETNAVR